MGGRFCSLNQTHLECESTLMEIKYLRLQNRVKTKKSSSPRIEEFLSPKSSEDQKKKKRSSPQFGTKFGRNWWHLFLLTGSFLFVQPALKPRWEDAESQWVDTNSRWGDACSVIRYNQSTINHKQEIFGIDGFICQPVIQLIGCAVEPGNRNRDGTVTAIGTSQRLDNG